MRDDNNPINWLIATYDGLSKTDVTVFNKGSGGIEVCAKSLPPSIPVFGGLRLNNSGKFVSFFYADQDTSVMKKGRASMHKNGMRMYEILCCAEHNLSIQKLTTFF